MTDFVTTNLYIKRHNITKLLYFGKTTRRNVEDYTGSGTYWKNHLKRHGNNVSTIWTKEFYDENKIKKFALHISKKYDIVKSKAWANLIIEDGMNGWPTGSNNPTHFMTAAQNYKKGNKFRGKRRPEHSIKVSGKNNGRYSHGNCTKEAYELERLDFIETRRIANRKYIQLSKQCIHCYLIGKGPNMIRYHFDNCKLNPDNPLNIIGEFSRILKIDNRGKSYTCPTCGFIGKNLGNMNRWHFNNCKVGK